MITFLIHVLGAVDDMFTSERYSSSSSNKVVFKLDWMASDIVTLFIMILIIIIISSYSFELLRI